MSFQDSLRAALPKVINLGFSLFTQLQFKLGHVNWHYFGIKKINIILKLLFDSFLCNAMEFQISLRKNFFLSMLKTTVMLTKVFTRVTFSNVMKFKNYFPNLDFCEVAN